MFLPRIVAADDVRLVEYEVTLNDSVAPAAVSATMERLAAAHRAFVSGVDPLQRHAFIAIPADKAATVESDPIVKSVSRAATSAGGRRIEHLKPIAMTSLPWSSGTYSYDAAGNIKAIGTDSLPTMGSTA